MYIFEVMTFFLAECLSNQQNFQWQYEFIRFMFLMPIVTKLVRMVIHREVLPPINFYDTSMGWSWS